MLSCPLTPPSVLGPLGRLKIVTVFSSSKLLTAGFLNSLAIHRVLGLGGLYLARLALVLAGIHLAWGYWLNLGSVLSLAIMGGWSLLHPETRRNAVGKTPYHRSWPSYRR